MTGTRELSAKWFVFCCVVILGLCCLFAACKGNPSIDDPDDDVTSLASGASAVSAVSAVSSGESGASNESSGDSDDNAVSDSTASGTGTVSSADSDDNAVSESSESSEGTVSTASGESSTSTLSAASSAGTVSAVSSVQSSAASTASSADGESTVSSAGTISTASGTSSDDGDALITENLTLVYIPAGTFLMGSPGDETGHVDNETQHSVTLTKGFYMGKYEVTQGLYEEVMGNNPSFFKDSPAAGEAQENRPVESASWYAVLLFCNTLSEREGLDPVYSINGNVAGWGAVPTSFDANWDAVVMLPNANGYRLPTEAEWEYACRAGTTTPYYCGDTWDDQYGWWGHNYYGNSGNKTHEVGKMEPNGWGLRDMAGNVTEWCWDRYDLYTVGAATDPQGPVSGPNRVNRGASYASAMVTYLRSAFRNNDYNPWRTDIPNTGFRVVRSAP